MLQHAMAEVLQMCVQYYAQLGLALVYFQSQPLSGTSSEHLGSWYALSVRHREYV